MMNKYLTLKSLCLLCVFFIILLCIPIAYSQQNNGESEKVSDVPKERESAGNNGLQDKSEEKSDLEKISVSIRNTSTAVQVLSVIVAFVTLFLAGILVFFERKRDKYEKYKSEISERLEEFEKNNREKLKELEKDNKDLLRYQINKMDDEIFQKLKKRLVRKFDMKIEELEETHESYRQYLVKKIENAVHPVEVRHNAAETVKWQAWYKFHPLLSNAVKEEKWDDFLSTWSKFHEFQSALASLLSSKQEIIGDGLGNFVSEKFPKDMIPDELWNLILILNEQKRFKKAYVFQLFERLGEKLDRSINEPPPFTKHKDV